MLKFLVEKSQPTDSPFSTSHKNFLISSEYQIFYKPWSQLGKCIVDSNLTPINAHTNCLKALKSDDIVSKKRLKLYRLLF